MDRARGFLISWIAMFACERPRSIDPPEAPDARTLIYVELSEGQVPTAVWVESDRLPPTFTLADDQDRYVLWHRRDRERLGLVLGENRVMPGARIPLPPDGALRLEADGRWSAVATVPGPLLAMPLFELQTRCERIEEGPLELWPGLPDLLDAEPLNLDTDKVDTALLTTRDQRLMTLDENGTLVELLSTTAPILAAAHDQQAVYALDADLRLTRRTWQGATTTTTTSLGGPPLPFDVERGVAALAVAGNGSVHLYLDYTASSTNTERRVSVLRLVGHTFEPWTDGSECGGRDRRDEPISRSRRLAPARDGESVLAGGICAKGVLRWRAANEAPPVLERIDRVTAVRRLGPVVYAGRVGETVLADDAEGGGWRMVYRSGGGRVLEDVADFFGVGVLVVGFNNLASRVTVILPSTADQPQETCFPTAQWPSRTRSVVQLGGDYLIVSDNGRGEELPPQRLRLRYTDD